MPEFPGTHVTHPPAFTHPVSEEDAAHYDAIRQQRGWSWEVLADYFGQQVTDPASPGLAEWARSQADAKPAKAKRGATRATEEAPEKR